MRLKATRLPLSEIADRWARESVRTPGELDLQAIRRKLFIALRNGDLTIADPQREQAARYVSYALTDEEDTRDWKHERRETPEPLQVTPDLLRKAMVPRQGATRDSHNIDDYDEVSVQLWFDEVTIDKEGFGFWCDDCGHQRPEFWFEKQTGPTREGQSAGGQSRGKPVISLLKTLSFIRDDLDGDITEGALIHWFREKGITSENRYTFRKDFEDAYIDNEEHEISWFDAETGKRNHRSLNSVRSHYSEVNQRKIGAPATP